MIYKVIANPTAGRGLARNNLPHVKRKLAELGIQYRLYETNAPKHATELAKNLDGYSGVVAVGGDGTINEVVNGMPKNKPLCIVPLGTGNDLARSLNIPFGTASLETIKTGYIKNIDLGFESEGLFVSSVALGLATEVMIRVNSKRQNGIFKGSFAIYLAIIASAFRLKPLELIIDADGDKKEVTSILTYVMNTPYTGGGLFLAPDADPTDGLLDLVIVRDIKGLELLMMLPKAYSGDHINHPSVEFVRAKNIKIISKSPSQKMIDGEIKGITPLKSALHLQKLNIYVPSA